MVDWTTGLSDEQIIAARHIGSHARLMAGPGTGKTKTLIRRVLALLLEHNINSEQIIVLTFTRVAAYQLREEINKVLEPLEISVPRVSTLHSFALRQLLKNTYRIDTLPEPLRIADDWEEKYIIEQNILTDLEPHIDAMLPETTNKLKKISKLFNLLSADWETLNFEGDENKKYCREPRFIGAWDNHRKRFGYILRSELVYQLKKSLQNVPGFELESNFKYALIDEFQDLNSCDLAIVDELAKLEIELFIAGDDDQSIYGFRFANPKGIRQFPDNYNSTKMNLKICYRCDRQILNIGEFIANLDFEREQKELQPKDGAGDGEVNLYRFDDQYNEANWVAEKCHELLTNNTNETILILLRSDYKTVISSPILTACEEFGLSIAKETLESPINENDGRLVMSFIKLIENINDDLAWYTLLTLTRGIGYTTMNKIRNYSNNEDCRFFEIINKITGENDLPFPQIVKNTIENTKSLINGIGVNERPLIENINHLIDNICDNANQSEKLKEYFIRIINESGSESFSDLAESISTEIENTEQQLIQGKVNIMTMHRAKGLSADTVIIIGAEDEYIPGNNKEGDERRLFYVSLTRAKHRLYITVCKNRRRQQRYTGSRTGKVLRHLTRFLRNGPLNITDIES